MANALRAAPLAWPTAILLAILPCAPAASAEPGARASAARVAPVARVDLGAPDPRCSDLAYPLWDDGMCVRAKCADDDTCDFSKVASAREPAAPLGLSSERWRTATASTVKIPARPASAGDGRPAASVSLLAEARLVDPRSAAPHHTPVNPTARQTAARPAALSKPPMKAVRPSIWSQIRAMLIKMWRQIQKIGQRLTPHRQVSREKAAP